MLEGEIKMGYSCCRRAAWVADAWKDALPKQVLKIILRQEEISFSLKLAGKILMVLLLALSGSICPMVSTFAGRVLSELKAAAKLPAPLNFSRIVRQPKHSWMKKRKKLENL